MIAFSSAVSSRPVWARISGPVAVIFSRSTVSRALIYRTGPSFHVSRLFAYRT